MSEPDKHKAGWTKDILKEIEKERARQDSKWGEQHHPDQCDYPTPEYKQEYYSLEAESYKMHNDWSAKRGKTTWDDILLEEVYEALSEPDPKKKIEELIQVAAVAVVWIEDLMSRGNPAS